MGPLLPLQPDQLLAAQDGTGSADGGHEQVQVVLVLADHFLVLWRVALAFLLMAARM